MTCYSITELQDLVTEDNYSELINQLKRHCRVVYFETANGLVELI